MLDRSEPRPSRDGFLQISNLHKTFGEFHAIRDVSLSIREGEFVSLLGPSGCGKTTTLRIIAGFVAPTAGSVWLDGARIDDVPSHRRGAAMVFQNYALFPHMTVAENVGFGLRMQKTAKSELTRRVGEALELVRLGALGTRYPKELSGGQQQRVALARAIVLKPKLLLLDEPLSNLDAKLRKELRGEFVDIHRVAGTTTVFVTHDLEEAFAVSDRVAVMNAGVVEQFDAPMRIFADPATPFVAEFVGHSNQLSGAAEAGVLRAGPAAVRLPEGVGAGPVRIAVPAHTISVTDAPVAADTCLPVTVGAAAYLGASISYVLEGDGFRFHAEVPVGREVVLRRPGDMAFMSFRADDVIVLPAGAA